MTRKIFMYCLRGAHWSSTKHYCYSFPKQSEGWNQWPSFHEPVLPNLMLLLLLFFVLPFHNYTLTTMLYYSLERKIRNRSPPLMQCGQQGPLTACTAANIHQEIWTQYSQHLPQTKTISSATLCIVLCLITLWSPYFFLLNRWHYIQYGKSCNFSI